MQDSIWILIWAVIVGGVFAWLWRAGHLQRFAIREGGRTIGAGRVSEVIA